MMQWQVVRQNERGWTWRRVVRDENDFGIVSTEECSRGQWSDFAGRAEIAVSRHGPEPCGAPKRRSSDGARGVM
jgi:hypothetical protein